MKVLQNKLLCRPRAMSTPQNTGVRLPAVRNDSYIDLIVVERGPFIKDVQIGDRILVHTINAISVIVEHEQRYFVSPSHVEIILD